MSNQNYALEIISHHPQFANKSLRKHYVDGIETVGAWGNEPFEIRFKNNTWQKIQVKLSVDGTDVFSGQPATTDVSDKMWVVNGYGTLSLKAWPENNNGGAAFVFTSADNSVAIHTHGNLSSRGIIAAAVFVEGHIEPLRINQTITYPSYPPYIQLQGRGTSNPNWYNYSYQTNTAIVGGIANSSAYAYNVQNCSSVSNSISDEKCSASLDCFCESPAAANETVVAARSRKKLAAVGAGQHVDQKISYVTGLIKPTFTESVRVRYMWWDDLVDALRTRNAPTSHASGFPGDVEQTHIDLKKTPRLGKKGCFKRAEQVFSRV